MNVNLSTNTVIPWVIIFFMTVYVFGLNYYANHRAKPNPSFGFYSSSLVKVDIKTTEGEGSDEDHIVMGTFNNIIEGERKTLEATRDESGSFMIPFEVNSPRSAFLYINDEAIEVFLVPDSTLEVSVIFNSEDYQIDSINFSGHTANICEYYQVKARQFERMHIRSYRNTIDGDSLERHAWVLDSLATNELAFLLIRSEPNDLPLWFIQFEKNEILYQKAYLKLANAYNREVYPGYLEDIEAQNENAVFSYYYYLYLRTLISQKDEFPGVKPAHNSENPALIQSHLSIADTLLKEEVRDVFMTSVIFNLIRQNQAQQAQDLLERYESTFSKKKYGRFLRMETVGHTK